MNGRRRADGGFPVFNGERETEWSSAMAQKESQTDKTQKSSLPNLIPPEFTAMGKKRLEELVGMQAELLEALQEMN